jgi:hypothetical protein
MIDYEHQQVLPRPHVDDQIKLSTFDLRSISRIVVLICFYRATAKKNSSKSAPRSSEAVHCSKDREQFIYKGDVPSFLRLF